MVTAIKYGGYEIQHPIDLTCHPASVHCMCRVDFGWAGVRTHKSEPREYPLKLYEVDF